MDPVLWANLPWQLMEEVLCRLPVDDIAKFRSVSQHWNKQLHSQEFFNLHEVARQDQDRQDGLWILATKDLFASAKVYHTSGQVWHRVATHGLEEPHLPNRNDGPSIRGNRGLLSDGGLVFYNDLVVNVLTGSQRRLHCPFYDGVLELSAVKADRSANFYQLIFLAEEASEGGLQCSYLLIYDSKEQTWRRTRSFERSLRMVDSTILCNGCIYFALDNQFSAVRDERALSLISYNLAEDTWGTCAITPNRRDLLMVRILHQWKNGLYVVSISHRWPLQRVQVDKIDLESFERRSVQNMSEFDFKVLLGGRCSRSDSATYLHGLTACGRFIGVSVICAREDARSEHEHFVLYDLKAQDWKAVSRERLPPPRQIMHMVAFDPSLSMAA